ncbi:unnamed protein product [Effrenium voratum]|nr:unnamed protein product [Effrenium voratum]CAJ1461565.1 unnamed protein product [Effrenium voratum]
MVARSGSSARASSLGNVGREYVPKQPRLSLFIPCERGLLNPPRTSEAMDNILQVMEVAWRQVNAARGSTVKLANPEHNLLVSFESARETSCWVCSPSQIQVGNISMKCLEATSAGLPVSEQFWMLQSSLPEIWAMTV